MARQKSKKPDRKSDAYKKQPPSSCSKTSFVSSGEANSNNVHQTEQDKRKASRRKKKADAAAKKEKELCKKRDEAKKALMLKQDIRREEFAEKIVTSTIPTLLEQFKAMKEHLDLTKMPAFDANLTTGRNRYKDVGCLEETRVKLDFSPVEYIHANYMTRNTRLRNIICTQAPVDKTRTEFWYMIYQEKIQNIVMLCGFEEEGETVCSFYFPENKGDIMNFSYGDIRVECISSSHDGEDNVFEREFLVSSKKNGEAKLRVNHFHWIDAYVGDNFTPPEVIRNVIDSQQVRLVVHCSDGVGRTGIMVYILHVEEELEKLSEAVKTPTDYLAELRKFRYGLLKREEEFICALRVLMTKKDSSLVARTDENVTNLCKKFLSDYKEIMEKKIKEGQE